MYDAFLFAYTLNEEGPISAMAYVNTAMLPFRCCLCLEYSLMHAAGPVFSLTCASNAFLT